MPACITLATHCARNPCVGAGHAAALPARRPVDTARAAMVLTPLRAPDETVPFGAVVFYLANPYGRYSLA